MRNRGIQKMKTISLAAAFLVSGAPVFAQVGYVTTSGSGAGDGSSWGDAYAGVSTALTNASSDGYDELWVQQGTYTVVDGLLDTGIAIYGGFAGTESALGDRDWQNNTTTLESDGTARVIRLLADTRLDGFTVTGGDAAGSSYQPG